MPRCMARAGRCCSRLAHPTSKCNTGPIFVQAQILNKHFFELNWNTCFIFIIDYNYAH